jgi:hypothetical protein
METFWVIDLTPAYFGQFLEKYFLQLAPKKKFPNLPLF